MMRTTLAVARYTASPALQPRVDPTVWVGHTIDALWASYSGEIPPELRTAMAGKAVSES